MNWMVVLRSGTALKISPEGAAALVEQVSQAALSGAPISVKDGVLVRVDDVLMVAPFAGGSLVAQAPVAPGAPGK